jgi:hypothetical protein
MKTLICTLAIVAMTAVAVPSFAGPNTGQPSHAQRIMQLNQHRDQIIDRPYALTGEGAMHRGEYSRDLDEAYGQTKLVLHNERVGAQRSHRVYVRVVDHDRESMRYDTDRSMDRDMDRNIHRDSNR